MNAPQSAEANSHYGNNELPDCGPRSTLLCCLTGGMIVGIGALLFLPLLLNMVSPFGILSSTVLVALLLFGWMGTWALIESAVESRYGCL